jgi:hypothetical protein
MSGDHLLLRLSHDQALVLSDWLARVMGTQPFDTLVDEDPAVWSSLYAISGTLEMSLVDVVAPDYGTRLERARRRLLADLGDVRPSSAE